jgi:hypothetical protein
MHENNVFSKQSKRIVFGCTGQRITAVLHNDGATSETTNIWKSLNQNIRPR